MALYLGNSEKLKIKLSDGDGVKLNIYTPVVSVVDGIIMDDWATIIARAKDGTFSDYYKTGDKKELVLNYSDGTSESVYASVVCGAFTYTPLVFGEKVNHNAIFFLTNPLKNDRPLTSSSLGMDKDWTDVTGGLFESLNSGEIYNAIPEELRNAIIPATLTGSQKLWLADNLESTQMNTYTYPLGLLFPDKASRILYKKDESEPSEWWLQKNKYSSRFYTYYSVKKDGTINYIESTGVGHDESRPKSIAFGFTI